MNKNPACELYLCTACPRGDCDVTDANEVIMRLCVINNLTLIDSNSDFYDKKGKLRYHFYRPRDNIHLARSGTKRLLGSINIHLDIVENFEECVFPLSRTTQSQRYHTTQDSTEIAARERCLKCGLTNHITLNCRHKQQVQCFKCHYYGHKDSSGLCNMI